MLIKKICCLLLLSTVLTATIARADDPSSCDDGRYSLSGAPNNNVQLRCTCAGNTFSVSPKQGSSGDEFSFNAIYVAMKAAHVTCPYTPNSQQAFFDMDNCQFVSTDATPITYANVKITAIGPHWMKPDASSSQANDKTCPQNRAVAANWQVTAVSDTADYMVSNKSAPADQQPTNCTHYICGADAQGKPLMCCVNWQGQLFKTVVGSVMVTGGPKDLQATCSQPSLTTTHHVNDDPTSLVIDLQAQHDRFAANKPDQSVTALCKLSSDGTDYGSLTLQDINGIRPSTKTQPAHIWSTITSVAQPPPVTTNAKLDTPVFTKDSDTSGNYHNLWSVQIQPAVYPGAVTITGAPVPIKVDCSQGISATVIKYSHKNVDEVIDFQTIHNKYAPGAPGTMVSPICTLLGTNGLHYGSITLKSLNGVRASQQHSGSSIWSAQVTITSPPSSATNYKMDTPRPSGDSDPDDQYFTDWTVTLEKK